MIFIYNNINCDTELKLIIWYHSRLREWIIVTLSYGCLYTLKQQLVHNRVTAWFSLDLHLSKPLGCQLLD